MSGYLQAVLFQGASRPGEQAVSSDCCLLIKLAGLRLQLYKYQGRGSAAACIGASVSRRVESTLVGFSSKAIMRVRWTKGGVLYGSGYGPVGKTLMEQSIEICEELRVVNSLGLHARPAARLVQTVLPFKSDVYISVNSHRVNAKSIMGLLTLAAAQGSRLEITCTGPDAREAMTAVRHLVESGFGED